MYKKPQIKERHSLVDLATYGSKSRRKIHSEVLVGEHPQHPIFKEGDILDANATFNLIQDTYDQEKVNKILHDFMQEEEDHLDELEERVYLNQQIMNEEIGRMDQQLQDMQEVVDDCNTRVTECEEEIQELEEKHDQDIQETKEYAKSYTDTQISDDRIRFAYDDIEENLRMFRNNNLYD